MAREDKDYCRTLATLTKESTMSTVVTTIVFFYHVLATQCYKLMLLK